MSYLHQLVFYFTIYSFLGWSIEVAYAYSISKKFVNRGFLFGPFCPIYGFGLLSLIVLIKPFDKNFFLFFLGSMLVTSIIEYLTGFILEKIFKTHWWDYSTEKFNLHGYICLKFSIYWGIFGTLLYYFIHPSIALLINNISPKLISILCPILILYFLTDFILTLHSLLKIKTIYKNLQKIKENYINIAEKFHQQTLSKLDFIRVKRELKKNKTYFYKKIKKHRLIKAFPKIKNLF